MCTAYSDYSWNDIQRRLGQSENLLILKKPFDNIEVIQLAHALTRKWLVSGQAQVRLEDLDQMVARRTAELQAANERIKRHSRKKPRRRWPSALFSNPARSGSRCRIWTAVTWT